MDSKFSSRLAFSLCATLFMGGCASVTVKQMNRDQAIDPRQRPTQLVITPFQVDGSRVKEHPARKEPGRLASETQLLIGMFLKEELPKLEVPVSASARGGGNTWIISGKVTRVEEGSRFLRMGIGLGAGGTKLETDVEVRLASARTPFLRFSTTGGSNAMPGAATTPIPFSALPAALMNSKDGITADAARTARMIASSLSQYMGTRGWPSGNLPAPKMGR